MRRRSRIVGEDGAGARKPFGTHGRKRIGIPDLELAAHPDKGNSVLQTRMGDEIVRQPHPAVLVPTQQLRIRQDRERAVILRGREERIMQRLLLVECLQHVGAETFQRPFVK